MATWYYASGGKRQGPVDDRTIRQLIAQGQVRASDLVWRDGMPQWTAAQNIPELNPRPAAAPQPPFAAPQRTASAGYPQPYAQMAPRGGYGYQQPQASSKGLAIAGFVCSLVGLLSCFPAVVGLVLSAIALNQMKSHGNRDGHGMAVSGLVIGIIVTVLGIGYFLIVMLIAAAEANSTY